MTYSETLDRLMELVVSESGVSIEMIKGKSRRMEIAALRHLYCYCARRYGFGLKTIGDTINRKHETALHSSVVGRDIIEGVRAEGVLIRSYARRIKSKIGEFERELG